MKIKSVRNAEYLSDDAINCEILFEGKEGYWPYTASASDPVSSGIQLWNDLLAGVYGKVRPVIKGVNRPVMCPPSVNVADHTWSASRQAMERLWPAAELARSQALPAGFKWPDISGEMVALDCEQLMTLWRALCEQQIMKAKT